MKIETPIEYMLMLDWDEDDVNHGKEFLKKWDERSESFYKTYKKIHKDFDIAEREHYRNCVNFWENRLKNENQST